MAYKDLHDFINTLDKKSQLKRIKTEVSTDLEITEITDRVSKVYGPALLFENVKNSKYPLLINAMGTYDRMNTALLVKDFNDIGDLIGNLMNLSNYTSIKNIIKSISRLSRLITAFPIKIPKGSCQEVVEMNPDLDTLPILKCWPQDGGRFITLPLVITKDPETGQQNTGMYRLQVHDKTSTGMHWHLHKDGREIYDKYRKLGGRMPVSVAIGCDPAITYAATAPLPKMFDEMMFAGFLRKFPVTLVKSKTNNIYVPSNAEFILEGYVDVNEDLKLEGPFGDHTGYYSLADYYPVFHVTCITHKKNAIYPTTIVGKPPMEDCYISKATERIFLPFLKMLYPDILDYNLPLEGVFHNCAIVSIKKRFPGHAKKVMNSLWGIGQMMYTKMLIIVDKDVNPHDLSKVAKVVFNNIDSINHIVINEGPLDALDHASDMAHFGHRLGIDATNKLESEGHNGEDIHKVAANDSIKNKISKLFKDNYPEILNFNFPLEYASQNFIVMAIDKDTSGDIKKFIKSLWSTQEVKTTKIIIVVDKDIDTSDLSTVAWKVFNNIDSKRDIVMDELCIDAKRCLRIGIDATKKSEIDGHMRLWPDDIEMSDEIKNYASKRWSEYGID